MIELKDVNKYFQVGPTRLHVINNASLQINQGDFVGIMGPSGSGKSTLVNVLGFLDNKYTGEYWFEGKPIKAHSDRKASQIRNQTVSFVFQQFNLIENLTIAENVELPLLYNNQTPKAAQKRVMEVLDKVGLADKAGQFPKQLSGGQKQRVAIARALVNHPKFIIADEPTGALDSKTSANIMSILRDLNRQEGVTIVMVTHDPNLIQYCTRLIRIVDGKIEKNEVLNNEI